MAASSAAARFRDTFGDRKPPDITRRITACVACRKLKIKCHMSHSKPPCTRCKARGLSCTVNKSIQMILEDDLTWKEGMENRVKALEQLLVANGVPNLDSLGGQRTPDLEVENQPGIFNQTFHKVNDAPPPLAILNGPDSPPDVTLNLSCSLGAFPGSSMTGQPSNDRGETRKTNIDLISRGCITETVARELFEYYHQNLDKYIYNLLKQNGTLREIRNRSSLLTAAVCAVSAFSSASQHYESCLKAFTDEVTGELFSTDHTFDEIRALCIGSFWLSDISMALCGLAVRFGSELNLHRCITKMPHTDPKCHERTQLYFLVFICDHHCSLKHGRPPMTRSFRSLKHPRTLLQSRFSSDADRILICHLELWSISDRVFELFGADVNSQFNTARITEIERPNDFLNDWRHEWNDAFHSKEQPDKFIVPILDMHYYSAKLCLFALVFRGPSPDPSEAGVDTAMAARHAVENAISFMRCAVASGEDILKWPSYFITIIAFSSIFLLRVSSHGPSSFLGSRTDLLMPLQELLHLLNAQNVKLHANHFLAVIKNGLNAAIGTHITSGQNTQEWNQDVQPPLQEFDFQLLPEDIFGLASAQNIDWNAFPANFETEFHASWDGDTGSSL
ncbi:hypothetical protein DM02DRAFT_591890 [Periconia macrospinosa]|uniref:Zn(2)-C6 fungal-type domain-containing protein n=1 Tax=Periconia macrospinosa TaxID=97972 RepID=A0A2V1DS91_9PLEO|nr:hypothetical protein DM02DRAFT_591890 [Periconia macrospinosa]